MWSTSRTDRRDRRRQHYQKPLGYEPLESRHLLAATVMISEFLARNDGGLRDANGNSPDWIELYNPGDVAIDLAGYRLTDDVDNLSKWEFPSVTLNAGEFLVVFASGRSGTDFIDEEGNLHTNFTLKRGGEYLAFSDPNGSMLSEFGSEDEDYPEQLPNVSFGTAQSAELVTPSSDSFYLVPLSASVDSSWMQLDFDPAAHGFQQGTVSLGLESSPANRTNFVGQFETELPEGTHAVYARTEFELLQASAVSQLSLDLKYDNGFVIYLNGKKILSENALDQISWFSQAVEDSRRDSLALESEVFDLTEHRGLLVDGTNVLAIHGLNHASDRSDMLLVPRLRVHASDTFAAIGSQAKVGLMSMPTPGGPNVGNDEVFSGFVADTQFSVDRGFFETPQQVEITSDTSGAEIRYTTDGNLPTISSGTIYTGPIPITTTTTLRAASFKPGFIPTNVDTQTYIFLEDVLAQPASPPGWPTDSASWGRFTPDYEMDPEVVGPYRTGLKDDLTAIPTISIVMDTEHLFGSSGILRTPTGQGIQFEQPASVELIHPDGQQGFQINSAIRVAGSSWNRTNIAKRGFRLLFKDGYGPNDLPTGGPTRLEYPLFADTDVESFNSIVLKGRADHSYLFTDGIRAQYVREHWSRDTMRDMGHVTTHGTYAHLYLNGLYWGLYAPFERPDGSFQADYQGGDPDQWYTLNGSSGWKGELGSDPLWNRMLASPDYKTALQYLDVDNFIDYMMVNFYAGNVDWPHHNWWAARKNEPGAKYQFFQNDTEMSFYRPTETNMDNLGGDPGILYRKLIQYPEFRLRFADRVHLHLFNDGALTPTRAAARWMSRAEQIDRAIVGESARWGDNRRSKPYTRDVEWVAERDRLLSDFFPTRTDFMVDQFRGRGLYPTVDAPLLNQHGGAVSSTFNVGMTAPEGTIYYTTDGSDPRLAGGAVSSTAAEYNGSLNLTTDATIKSRVLHQGEWSALSEAEFHLASELPLRITEINYNPHQANPIPGLGEGDVDNDRFEFVELMNVGGQPINLNGVQFVREEVNGQQQGIRFTFASQLLEPGQRVLVVRDRKAFQSRYGTTARIAAGDDGGGGEQGEYGGKLANRGEQIVLVDSTDRIIQGFAYGSGQRWPARANGKGSSLEIVDVAANYSDADNWRGSAEFGGSPGIAQGRMDRKIVINEVLAHTSQPQVDMVELRNTSAHEVNITGWYLSDTEDDYFKFQIAQPTTLPALGYQVFAETDFSFDLDSAHGESLWLIESDASGRPSRFVDHVQFGASPHGVALGPWPTPNDPWVALALPTFGQPNAGPRIGDIVISEVHYSPVDPDGEGRLKADDFQFIELYNRTGSAIEVTDWQLAGDVDFTFPAGTLIGAEETVVVVGFKPTISTKASVFRFTVGMNPSASLVGPFQGTLDDAEGLVRLVRPDNPPANQPDFAPLLVVDEVNYRSVLPWPSSAAGAGDSLTRTGPPDYGNFPTSWTASTPSPGIVDFILRHAGDANEDGQLNLLDIDLVLQGSKYLTGEPASWSHGDWNGDGVFDQLDIVAALKIGNYSQRP